MDTQRVDKMASKWRDRVKKTKGNYECRGSSHFAHITNNLITPVGAYYDEDLADNEIRSDLARNGWALRTYLDLVERHGDFREAEIGTSEGFFSNGDIENTVVPYIEHSSRELRLT